MILIRFGTCYLLATTPDDGSIGQVIAQSYDLDGISALKRSYAKSDAAQGDLFPDHVRHQSVEHAHVPGYN